MLYLWLLPSSLLLYCTPGLAADSGCSRSSASLVPSVPPGMEGGVIRFSHCGKLIFCRFVPEECPVCGERLSGRRLEDAPLSVPSPFSDGHRCPCAFLMTSPGDAGLRDFDGHSDLHTGISNTKGVVYNFRRSGVERASEGWSLSLSVPLVQPHSFSLLSQWDQYLESFSAAHMWDPQYKSFDEDQHNCFSFTLMFINCVLAVQGRPALTKEQFTHSFILPRMKRVQKYSALTAQISSNHFYIVDNPRRDSLNPEDEEKTAEEIMSMFRPDRFVLVRRPICSAPLPEAREREREQTLMKLGVVQKQRHHLQTQSLTCSVKRGAHIRHPEFSSRTSPPSRTTLHRHKPEILVESPGFSLVSVTFETLPVILLSAARDLQVKGRRENPEQDSSTRSTTTE
ncbi:hypothetical protein DNTS_023053 [Danionella cerebrum]|uniref:MKRN2 opposite strand protein n=1 Tax=Danionella cerebrum TaxID=2873325 RepID=A0A553Q5B8_9TELE|nr:hypothetical protein DNTS_023053 [Danionella translucida]